MSVTANSLRRLLLVAALFVAVFGGAQALAHGEEHKEDEATEASETLVDEGGATVARPSESADAHAAEEEAEAGSPFAILRNLHPATVHFPIALIVLAALAELLAMRRPAGRLRAAAEVMAILGGLSASLAGLFGWIHTGLWMGGDATMQAHRWIGTALALLGPWIAWLAYRAPERRTLFRTLLFAMAVAVLAQGFLGGEISHGAGHLFEH